MNEQNVAANENRILRAALRDLGNRASDEETRERVSNVLAEADLMRRKNAPSAIARREARWRYYRYVKPQWWQRNPLYRLLVEEVGADERHDFKAAR